MVSAEPITINNALQLLKNTYNALDIRAILVRQDDRWICLFCVIRATRFSKAEVEERLRRKRSNVQFSQPENARIMFEARNIIEFGSVLEGLNAGIIAICGINASIVRQSKIQNEVMGIRASDSILENEYPNLVCEITSSNNSSPVKMLETYALTATDFNIGSLDDLDTLFDTAYIKSYVQILIHLPIYCRISRFVPTDNKTVVLEAVAHHILARNIVIRKEIKQSNRLIEMKIIQPRLSEINHNQFVTLSANFDISQLPHRNILVVKIEHNSLLRLVEYESFIPENHQGQLIQSATFNRASAIYPRIAVQEFLKVNFNDYFYDNLKSEINQAYEYKLYTSVSLLSRKMIQELVFEILRAKFPASDPRNLNLYYNRKDNRQHDFTILLMNLDDRKAEFGIDQELVSEILSYIKPFRKRANSNTHSIIKFPDEAEIRGYKLDRLVSLLMRVKGHL